MDITPDLAETLAFDLREIDECIEIVESFDTLPDASELARLRILPKGEADPDADADGRARDAQYELFLRAIFRAGAGAPRMAEPDLLVTLGERSAQVAAKRPTSDARLDDRLRHAVRQVERRSEIAVVAISLDHVLRPHGSTLLVPTEQLLAPSVRDLTDAFVNARAERLAPRIRGRRVHGLLFTARIPAVCISTQRRALGTYHRLEVLAEEGTRTYQTVSRVGVMIREHLS